MRFEYWQRDRSGFTLVELLTIIGILGILAGLLFPVLITVRKQGQRTVCASNLRQLHTALHLYIQDYDGAYPAAINPADAAHPQRWAEFPEFMAVMGQLPQCHQALAPYTKAREIFRCPSDFGLKVLDPFPGWRLNAAPSSYATFGTSYFYHTKLVQQRAHDTSITKPADTWVLMDPSGQWHGSESEHSRVSLMRRYNLLFADGHVRNLTHQALGKLWTGPGGSD